MKFKILILFALYFGLAVFGFFSCVKCGFKENKKRIIGLDWGIQKANFNESSSDSMFYFSEIENDSVYYENYSIYIDPIQEFYSFLDLSRPNFNVIPTACACDPVMPVTTETIENIEIFSETDFDSNHLAGSNLSDLFDVVLFNQLEKKRYQKLNLNSYLATNPIVPYHIILILRQKPLKTTGFEFSIKYSQKGQFNHFEFKTKNVIIKDSE